MAEPAAAGVEVLVVVFPAGAVPAPVPRVVAEAPAEVDSVVGLAAVLGSPSREGVVLVGDGFLVETTVVAALYTGHFYRPGWVS